MAIKKKEISLDSIKSKFSTKTKYKTESFYNCGESFMDACGLPGPVMGGINIFLGHTNTSKTTAMILAAADAQKRAHDYWNAMLPFINAPESVDAFGTHWDRSMIVN